MAKSGSKQIPFWESISLRGNFYFSTKGKDNRFSGERARLAKERRELEQLRSEIERKQREAQNQRIEVASVPQKSSYMRPSSSTSNVINRDGIYVAYANGIVKDTKTGLGWKVGPDKETTLDEAQTWVESLNLDGGGWRMPTINELHGLYNKGAGDRNMTPLLKTTGWWVWSGETEGSAGARFFHNGSGGMAWGGRNDRDCSDYGRGFAVRSRSDG